MFSDYTVSAEVTEDGRLELSDRQAFSRAMRHFRRGPVSVRIQVDHGKRSNQANRYYRLVLGLIGDCNGDDSEDLHDFFKKRFLTPEVHTVLGEGIAVYTTRKLSPEQFYEYVENVRRFALTELGVVTPDPDPAMRGRSRHAKKEAA